MWLIKRASDKGIESVLMWSSGGRALEACRSSKNEWFNASAIVSGASGPNASAINGFFDYDNPTSEIHGGRIRCYKRGDASVWIDASEPEEDVNIIFQIKRASAIGTDVLISWSNESEFICPHGGQTLKICFEDVEVEGVKLYLQMDAEYKVICPCYPRLFLLVPVMLLLIVTFLIQAAEVKAAAEAQAASDAAEKAKFFQTLQLLEQLGLQDHIPTFM